jgi:hypothetical protein
MEKSFDQLVRRRAGNRCGYCRVPQAALKPKFPIDHIIARQHQGPTEPSNLALCCGRCNQYKGPNLSGLDPATGNLTRLFHPRRDDWHAHFRFVGPVIEGLTEVGRTTVAVLNMNHPYSIGVRRALINEGVEL